MLLCGTACVLMWVVGSAICVVSFIGHGCLMVGAGVVVGISAFLVDLWDGFEKSRVGPWVDKVCDVTYNSMAHTFDAVMDCEFYLTSAIAHATK